MRFEVTFFDTGIGVTISNEHARFREIWLVDAIKAAWRVWSELGWEGPGKVSIKKEEWEHFLNRSTKHSKKAKLIQKIAKINRLSQLLDFDINANFEQGADSILDIISNIKNGSFYFETCDEISQFRHVITLYLAAGIKRGIETPNFGECERFIYAIRDALIDDPIEYPTGAEIYFNRFKDETIISLTGAREIENLSNCDFITVEL